ncbi:MFS transporter [Lentzea sp. BCCO 10_0798]|uniref:MFS transporter n=1 Tax=Lentzea kristufekii TaxID=3095430 RepID=A0ABU4U533_9PSEU|nr:MFS transporter [Lentzea sp. BCCO 10_0798]MDX8055689.1 MFS transporter [Lentzea sp. BCCO 10_0798]
MKLLPAPGPKRLLAFSWFVKTIGSGLYLPTSTLYFTRVAGFGVRDVALGLTAAGLVSLAGSVPLGGLADRFGPRRVYTVLLATQFLTLTWLVLVRSFPWFLCAITVFLLAEQGSTAARGALVATVGEGAERVRFRAYLRVVTNIGITVGAGLAALAIQSGTTTAYTVLLLGTAATYVGAAVPLRRLPADVPTGATAPRSHPLRVFRDGRYVLVTFACGVLSLHGPMLSFALPLWIVGHTTAPPLVVAALVVVNTVMVIFLQTRASRDAEDNATAARLCRWAGLVLFAACCVIVPTGYLPPWSAVALLVLFVVLLTAGELWTSAGSFGLSFALAPEGAHGQYQGFFALGRGFATAAAPGLLTVLCLGSGPGWLVLGLCFACVGALTPLIVKS